MQTDRYSRTQIKDREVDTGLRNHFNNVYMLMALGLLVTSTSAYISAQIPALQDYLVFMRSNMFLGMIIMFSPMILASMMFNGYTLQRASVATLSGFFLLFSVYWGVLFSTMLLMFTEESIARVFLITCIMFAGMSLYGYTTKTYLGSMGSMLRMAVWGLVVAMFVNYFMESAAFYYFISGIGVVIFTLMVASDTQSIKETYNPAYGETANGKMAVMGALALYIDFIMIFQFLIQFMGNRE